MTSRPSFRFWVLSLTHGMTLYFGPFVLQTAPGCLKNKGFVLEKGEKAFKDEFEKECQRRGVRLYVVRPRSPEEQGYVERAQGIHRYEFYESYDLPLELGELRQVVREWEYSCNFLRPSRPLGGKTLWEYLMENHREAVSFEPQVSHIYWTRTPY